jgi:hypothetical protein
VQLAATSLPAGLAENAIVLDELGWRGRDPNAGASGSGEPPGAGS